MLSALSREVWINWDHVVRIEYDGANYVAHFVDMRTEVYHERSPEGQAIAMFLRTDRG